MRLLKRGSLEPITGGMSIESAIERVAAINAALKDPVLAAQGSLSGVSGGTEAPSEAAGTGEPGAAGAAAGSFAAALQRAAIGGGSAEEGLTGEGAEGAGAASGLSGALSLSTASSLPLGTMGLPVSTALPAGGSSAAAGSDTLPVADPGGAYDAYDPEPAALAGAYPSSGVSPSAAPGADDIGGRIVAIAESQVGQAEQPLGSGEGPAIAMYRSATAGAIPGAPWCAYFASWVAREAGVPLGSEGQGLGSVAEIWSWAQSTGRAIPNGPGVVPKPGDLIVFGDEHVGIVRGVLPDGRIATVEGNYENKVSLNERSPSEPTGYVEL